MKTLLALMLVGACANANATATFYTPNADGGQIILTDVQGGCPVGAHLFYATTGAGEAGSGGCWTYAEPLVHAVWIDGTVRNYNVNNFTATAEAIKKYHLKIGVPNGVD